MDELRARAYLDALLGRHPTQPVGNPPHPGRPGIRPARQHPRRPAHRPGPAQTAGPRRLSSARPFGPARRRRPAGPPTPRPHGGRAVGSAGRPRRRPHGHRRRGPGTGPALSGLSTAGTAATAPGCGGLVPPAHRRSGIPAQSAAPRRPPAAAPAPAPAGPTGFGGRLAARINLTVPLTTLLGLPGGPGDIGGFGPIDPALARDITRRAAAHPRTSWSLTITHTGHAIAHIAARRARLFLGDPRGPGGGGPHDGGPGAPRRRRSRPPATRTHKPPGRPPGPSDLTVNITPLARGGCDHRTEEFRYQPSRRLRSLVIARTATCSAPGCRRPAARCDLDHTIAFDHGGRSCECNLAPLCRHHHRCKQAEGWRLEQITPGIMRWTTPPAATTPPHPRTTTNSSTARAVGR